MTAAAGLWLVVTVALLVVAISAVVGRSSGSDVLALAAWLGASCVLFMSSALFSTWWRARIDRLLTPRSRRA